MMKVFLMTGHCTFEEITYKICMYFTKSNIIKYAPLTVLLKENDFTWESMAISEITAYPLGFILYFNPTDTWNYDGIDITSFSECSYEDKANIEVPLCIKEVNDLFPTYYRSKEDSCLLTYLLF